MPEHLPAGLLASAAELNKGEVRVAHKRLEALAKLQPDALPVLRLLAQSQLRLGRPEDAAISMRRGLAQAPRDPQLLSMKADFELGNRQVKQAVATLGELLQMRPGDPDTLLRLADVRLPGETPRRPACCNRPRPMARGRRAPHGRIVSVALRMNDKPLARRLADQGVAAQPDDPQVMLTLAAVQSAQGDGTGAWKTTLAVLDKQPGIPNALTALSAMARTAEQRAEVLERHARAVQAKTSTAKVYLDYAALLRANPAGQDTPRAVLELGITVLPEATELHEALVQDHLRSGDAEKALAVAQLHANGPHAPGHVHRAAGAACTNAWPHPASH
ncbi:MAG: tetratricopeptide repeat protein [Rubrivivax sp.]|nr:tetratricopeptide repeat protein [Rubrivivax sp.]